MDYQYFLATRYYDSETFKYALFFSFSYPDNNMYNNSNPREKKQHKDIALHSYNVHIVAYIH
jgi:hypothetical protein